MSDPTRSSTTNWRDDPNWPDVDVVMPIRNEALHLENALDSVRAQDYPGTMRIILGVGPSDDGTEDLATALALEASDLTVIDNPSGKTPSALNAAIRAGTAPVVVRVDGHSQLSSGYLERAVETMRRTGAANVGGMQVPVPTTPFEAAVATATTSWIGTGGASYRTGGTEASVDTVYLGVFDRRRIESVGLFDEHLIRNQDYELNIRLRKAGNDVIFDPALSVGYTPRGTWSALVRQYFEYGWWKAEVLRFHPDSLRLRQFAPPIAMAGILTGLATCRRQRSMALVPAAYCGLVLHAVSRTPQFVRTAGVIVTVHATWSAGLLCGFVRSRMRRT